MPVDREKALGASLGETEGAYEADDVILYHLGIGAGFQATDPRELEYTYEKNLKVLPSFVMVAGGRRPSTGGGGGFKIPGVEFNLVVVEAQGLGDRVLNLLVDLGIDLHGLHELELCHRGLPGCRLEQ